MNILFICSCNPYKDIYFRQEMRVFIMNLSKYAKEKKSDFIIIPQNGQELITDSGEATGIIQSEYLNAIDATGRESMFYGYYKDNEKTPDDDMNYLLGLSLLCEQNGIKVLATDYCSDHDKMSNSYQLNNDNKFISFAANKRELTTIPDYPTPIYNENSDNIMTISNAKNFLYLINGDSYPTKKTIIDDISMTNYDLVLIDLYQKEEIFTSQDITKLKVKKNGSSRLVIAYMSIGEAEEYRAYWQESWKWQKPDWLERENPNWEGNYKVKYWDLEWQKIIYGEENSYLDLILEASFDGVYLDIVDAFEYFE